MRRTIAATLVLAAACPGAALAQTYSVQNTTADANGNKLNEGANARVLGGDADTVAVQFECFANTTPPASQVGIDACYIAGADGTKFGPLLRNSGPGSFTLSGGAGSVTRQPYRVCVQARASWWFFGTPGWLEAPLVCST